MFISVHALWVNCPHFSLLPPLCHYVVIVLIPVIILLLLLIFPLLSPFSMCFSATYHLAPRMTSDTWLWNALKSIMSLQAHSFEMMMLPLLGNFFNPSFSVRSTSVLSLTIPFLLFCLSPVKNGLLWCAEFVSGSVFALFSFSCSSSSLLWLLIWVAPPRQSRF